jgi:hypothetical protein
MLIYQDVKINSFLLRRDPNEKSSLEKFSDTTTEKTKGQQIAVDLRRTIQHFIPGL